MVDIVERLRDTTGIHENLIYEAADEIERLRKEREIISDVLRGANDYSMELYGEIERLREALHTIVATKTINEINPQVDSKMMWIGCIQIAETALKESE